MYTVIREYENKCSIETLITKIISNSIKTELEQGNKSHNDEVVFQEEHLKNRKQITTRSMLDFIY